MIALVVLELEAVKRLRLPCPCYTSYQKIRMEYLPLCSRQQGVHVIMWFSLISLLSFVTNLCIDFLTFLCNSTGLKLVNNMNRVCNKKIKAVKPV